MDETNTPAVEDSDSNGIFDGNQFDPQFASALTNFINNLIQVIANGVAKIIAGVGIGISSGTGNVTITNTGVTSAVAGTAISVSAATGAVTIGNTGVTSAIAGTGITVSGATGAVTISSSTGAMVWKQGYGSRSLLAASATVSYAHGFTGTPKYARVTGAATNNNYLCTCMGFYDSLSSTSQTFQTISGNGTTAAIQIDASTVVNTNLIDISNCQTATATLDATNLNLIWTKAGLGDNTTFEFVFEVWG